MSDAEEKLHNRYPDLMNHIEVAMSDCPHMILDFLMKAACIRAHFEGRTESEFAEGMKHHWDATQKNWNQSIVRVARSQPGGSS